MSGNAYIVFDDNSNKRKSYGKNINPDTTIANSGLSEYQIYKMNRGKIRNLVMYDDYQESTSDHQYCDLCKQRRIPQTKQQLLSTYIQNVQREILIRRRRGSFELDCFCLLYEKGKHVEDSILSC